MSGVSLLEGVYTAGINAERNRLLTELPLHLHKVHGLGDDAIAQSISALKLHKPQQLPPASHRCNVCGVKYAQGELPTLVHGQPVHETCIKSNDDLLELLAIFEEGEE